MSKLGLVLICEQYIVIEIGTFIFDSFLMIFVILMFIITQNKICHLKKSMPKHLKSLTAIFFIITIITQIFNTSRAVFFCLYDTKIYRYSQTFDIISAGAVSFYAAQHFIFTWILYIRLKYVEYINVFHCKYIGNILYCIFIYRISFMGSYFAVQKWTDFMFKLVFLVLFCGVMLLFVEPLIDFNEWLIAIIGGCITTLSCSLIIVIFSIFVYKLSKLFRKASNVHRRRSISESAGMRFDSEYYNLVIKSPFQSIRLYTCTHNIKYNTRTYTII